MRILIVTDTYRPDVNGAARFSERLAGALAARGHEVIVAAPSADGVARREQHRGVRIRRTRSHRYPWHRTMWVCLPDVVPEARRLVAEVAPDVVHVQGHFVLGRAVLHAARRRGTPVVATNHFMPENLAAYAPVPQVLHRSASALAWRDLARTFARADLVTAPTPRAVDLLVAAGLRGVTAVSNGVDVPPASRPHTERDDEQVRVLFVGRLDPEKRVGELIRAVAALPPEPPVQLEIVGDGPCRNQWQVLAHRLGVGHHVRFHGQLSDTGRDAAYARAAVFVMPGVAELQSLATLEGMAAGLPVVAADAMALPHLVRPGVNGWLYPPGDVTALHDRLADLSADSGARRAMGAASRQIARRHAFATTVSTYEGLYRLVLDRNSVRSPLAA